MEVNSGNKFNTSTDLISLWEESIVTNLSRQKPRVTPLYSFIIVAVNVNPFLVWNSIVSFISKIFWIFSINNSE